MKRVTIDLPEKWIKLARSPVRIVIASATCVALTFVPLFLFLLGKEGISGNDPRVIACLAAVAIIPLVYLRFATVVIKELRRSSPQPG